MSLICSVCKNTVPEGFNQCLACKAGFAPQLACERCRKLLPRGAAVCESCVRSTSLVVPTATPELPPPTVMALVAPLSAPPALPGLPSHVGLAKIPEQYNAGRYGVTATVQVPARDVEIMNKMGQVVVILHTLAAEMNSFQGHMDSTRSVIRQCRALATELQDEIETRRGPQG